MNIILYSFCHETLFVVCRLNEFVLMTRLWASHSLKWVHFHKRYENKWNKHLWNVRVIVRKGCCYLSYVPRYRSIKVIFNILIDFTQMLRKSVIESKWSSSTFIHYHGEIIVSPDKLMMELACIKTLSLLRNLFNKRLESLFRTSMEISAVVNFKTFFMFIVAAFLSHKPFVHIAS